MSIMNILVEARWHATGNLGSAIRRVMTASRVRRRLRRDLAQLMRLDTRMLDDIGLGRNDPGRL